MEPRGVGTGWLCIAVLCSGAAFVLKKEEPGHQSTTQRDDVLEPGHQSTTQRGDVLEPGHQSTTQRDDVPEPMGDPTTATGQVDKLMTWPTVTPAPRTGDPITTPVPTQAGAAGNKTQNAAAVPIRYWSPAIFVVVALIVLFFTYRRTKGEGSQDQAASASDSSDLGALDHLPTRDTTPIIPAPQAERKGPEKPPALEHTETTFCEPDPPPPQPLLPQPDTPPAAGGASCCGEPGAD